ncbi:MAG: 4Fe-4S dicluster domain-containing protein [Magnetospirillum sp.]|nr:4Fe-4S dicluster domain-containing protein [Magnetospirillum sp.]
MSASPTPTGAYDLAFARWVYANVDGGDRMALCMQCGTCSGSCPIGAQMDHGPRKLFMMIRAGLKDQVLASDTIWNCVSCYNCVVRCPRKVPVTYILHDLATVALREGNAAAKASDNARFGSAFWWSAAKYGRTDERLVTAKYYWSFGLGGFIKRGMANQKIAMGMVKTKRMHIGMPHKVKGTGELAKILAKAAEIEARNHG